MVLPLVMMAGGQVLNGMGEQAGADAMAHEAGALRMRELGRQQTMRDLMAQRLPQFGAAGMQAGIDRNMRPIVEGTKDIGSTSDAFIKANVGRSPVFATAIANGVQNGGDRNRVRSLSNGRLWAAGQNRGDDALTMDQLSNEYQMLNDQSRVDQSHQGERMRRAGQKGKSMRQLGSLANMAGAGWAQNQMWQPAAQTYDDWYSRDTGRRLPADAGSTDLRTAT
jgi:hypothetical protein